MQCYNVKTSIRNSSWSTRRKMGVWKTRCFEIECGGSPATEFGKAYEGRVEQSWWTKGMGFHGNAIFSFDVPSWPNRLKRIQFDMKYLDASIRSIPLGFVSLNWELPAVILNQVEGSEPVVRRVSSLLGVRTREAQVVGKIGLSTVQSDERGSGRLAAGCRLQMINLRLETLCVHDRQNCGREDVLIGAQIPINLTGVLLLLQQCRWGSEKDLWKDWRYAYRKRNVFWRWFRRIEDG